MKSTILHDEHGEIVAISKIGNLKEAGSKFVKVGMVPGAGQRVLEIELSREEEKRTLRDLHAEYRVDLATSKLIKKEI